MLRTILVGLDRSGTSDVAVRLGIRWAKRTKATLVGVAIVDEPGVFAMEPTWPVGGSADDKTTYYMGYEARLAMVEKQTTEALDRFVRKSEEESVAHIEVKRTGSPHKIIEQESHWCDLVLMARGSQFRSIACDDEADDTLKSVLKNGPRQIVIVPSADCSGDSVVIAYDGSIEAARALAAFESTGLAESGKVHVITVSENTNEVAGLAAIACKFLSRHDIDAVSHELISSRAPADIIAEQVLRLNAGLIVMGAYGQSAVHEFFVGSTTRRLVQRSPAPLFLYR